MLNHKAALGAALFCAASGIAIACSIDVGPTLLEDRDATLRAPVENSFRYEIERIAGPLADNLRYQPPRCEYPLSQDDCDRRVESEGLGDDAEAILRAARASATPYEAAAGLPEAVRHYVAGAVDYHSVRLDSAAQHFRAVLALPESDARPRAVWAAYMLGRLAALSGDPMPASAAFAQARALAAKGLPDPHGLAVASLGEEARLHFRLGKALLADGHLAEDKTEAYLAEMSAAANLYMAQAVRGDDGGETSLRIVLRHLLAQPATATAAAAVRRPDLRRLLVAHLLGGWWWNAYDPDETTLREQLPGPQLLALIAEAVAAETAALPDGDRLAALAYGEGRYDLARQLAEKAEGPLALWVRAKLAVQAGDGGGAAALYAQAIRALPAADGPLDPGNRRRLTGEAGVLALSRGDYTAAMAQLFSAGYWEETALVGERLLTLDELKQFVDAQVPAVAANERHEMDLRDLLARRLVREHRVTEALPYFHQPETRAKAADYAAALADGQSRWTRLGRAEALWQAAVLAREDGMEMMGTLGRPDYGAWGGGVECCFAGGDPVGADEARRWQASTPIPDRRFHYRYVAAEHALKAAEQLPPRSQAFAAVLCRASGWMLQSNADAEAWSLYQRYVRDGALVPFGAHFGRNCPDPDFAAAPASERRLMWLNARAFLADHKWLAILGLLAPAALGAAWWLHRRRNRPGPPMIV